MLPNNSAKDSESSGESVQLGTSGADSDEDIESLGPDTESDAESVLLPPSPCQDSRDGVEENVGLVGFFLAMSR